MRIVLSMLLLAPPAFCMGMMFPLGLGIWRRATALHPYFWSANGITSMLASVLGMALSIEFGIAKTYALGVGAYAVCALMIVVAGRQTSRVGLFAARPVSPDAAGPAVAGAPSIQPARSASPAMPARANEAAE